MNTYQEEYNLKGYIVLKNAICKKLINNARIYLSKKVNNELNLVLDGLNSKNFNKKKKILNKLNISEKKKSILSGQFSKETRISKTILKLATNIPMIKKISKTINKKIGYFHMPTMSRFVLSKNKYALTLPHQDITYNTHMSDFCTVWIPLVKIDKYNGGLKFYKNKINKMLPTNKSDKFIWQKQPNIKLRKFEDINNLDIGDIVIFNKYLIHSSIPNNSKKIRFSIDIRYMGVKDKTKKSYYDLKKKKINVVK